MDDFTLHTADADRASFDTARLARLSQVRSPTVQQLSGAAYAARGTRPRRAAAPLPRPPVPPFDTPPTTLQTLANLAPHIASAVTAAVMALVTSPQ